MEIVKLGDLMEDGDLKQKLLDTIKKGDIIIYPADSVYGIGCDIENGASVKKIVEAKQKDRERDETDPERSSSDKDLPLSVIAPSMEWILANCQVSDFNKPVIEKLFPGPYTVVLRVKKDSKIPSYIMTAEHTIGVRIPRNKLTDIIRSSGMVIITTSVNISGQEPATKIEDIPEQIKNIVSIAIDAVQLSSSSSRVFDLTTDEMRILKW